MELKTKRHLIEQNVFDIAMRKHTKTNKKKQQQQNKT